MGDELRAQLAALNEGQAAELLRLTLARMDRRDPAIDEEELESRREEDVSYVRSLLEATGTAKSDGGGAPSVRELVLVLHDQVPEARPVLAEELDEARVARETLDMGLGVTILILAIGTAILRPRVKIHKASDGESAASDLEVEVRGVENLDKLLKALIPFL
jgi:hypothetical protein